MFSVKSSFISYSSDFADNFLLRFTLLRFRWWSRYIFDRVFSFYTLQQNSGRQRFTLIQVKRRAESIASSSISSLLVHALFLLILQQLFGVCFCTFSVCCSGLGYAGSSGGLFKSVTFWARYSYFYARNAEVEATSSESTGLFIVENRWWRLLWSLLWSLLFDFCLGVQAGVAFLCKTQQVAYFSNRLRSRHAIELEPSWTAQGFWSDCFGHPEVHRRTIFLPLPSVTCPKWSTWASVLQEMRMIFGSAETRFGPARLALLLHTACLGSKLLRTPPT